MANLSTTIILESNFSAISLTIEGMISRETVIRSLILNRLYLKSLKSIRNSRKNSCKKGRQLLNAAQKLRSNQDQNLFCLITRKAVN